ncbi:cell wall-active antibiotics response protein [Tuanshanicoccus lijuaniae]|uniref:cell wall-active antibiotics response protein LiaF n=1 Tax=Aerococcaceae bacterium zg-1292 TaxID=2774330 RepID=UPI0019361E37|nr:cell wall-active antibiotics response protein [Aerococcaceae bacterium zg-1292]QQA38002.1 cell wall-active antibiotics response protein [Aerococcaceae bacterium zg-1292]
MREQLKKYSWMILAFSLLILGIDIFNQLATFVPFIVSIVMVISALFISMRSIQLLVFWLGVFILTNVLINSYAFLGFILVIGIVLLVFQTKEGNELVWFHEAFLHPFTKQQSYVGVKVIQPQINQRSRIYKQALPKYYETKELFEWQDINIAAVGGDSIIDLGATLLPEGENVIVIQKVFGRTRIIIPHGIGLLLNVSLINGKVLYEQDIFPLINDNFRWQSKDYAQATRKVKIVVSSVFSDVEVIRV